MYVQVRFELVFGSETSCLAVHLLEKAQIDASFDMMLNTQNKKIEKVMVGHEKDAYLDKKNKMINKITHVVRENPREGIKKPWFEQERNILDWLNLYYVLEREHYNKVPFLSYQLSTFTSQNIWLGSCPRSSVTCSFYTLRNMAEYKDRCQVSIFYLLRSFYSCDIFC